MKAIKMLAVVMIAAITVVPAMAFELTWTTKDGTQTIDVSELGLDDDLVKIIEDHQNEIQDALGEGNISSATAQSYVDEAKKAYEDFVSDAGIDAPYTTATTGLNEFTDVLVDVIPNTQIQQNVWANAWIGNLIPKPHFGLGVNAGVSKLDLDPLIKTGDALGIGMDGIPSTLVWPTLTADLRLGGFILPFDVGFTISSIDSSKLSFIGDAIDPASFDFFTIGGDVRYALIKGGTLRPKVSVGAGYYYTKGSLNVDDDDAGASLDFKSSTLVLNAQASIKLLFFVPFAGARVMFSKSSVDWSARADWASILNTDNSSIQDALKYGILPETFSGGSSSGYFDHIRPVFFAGFSLDIAVIDITVSASYDVISQIPSGALSLRFALN